MDSQPQKISCALWINTAYIQFFYNLSYSMISFLVDFIVVHIGVMFTRFNKHRAAGARIFQNIGSFLYCRYDT